MASSRNERKLLAIERARRRLENRLADIDWELDVLAPKVASLRELEKAEDVTVEAGEPPELEPGE